MENNQFVEKEEANAINIKGPMATLQSLIDIMRRSSIKEASGYYQLNLGNAAILSNDIDIFF